MENTRPAGTTMENSWTSWGASRHGMRVITREKLIRLIYRYSSEFFFFFSFDKSISRYITFRSRRCPLHIHLYPVNPRATRRGRLARQIGLGGKMERWIIINGGEEGGRKKRSLFYRCDALISLGRHSIAWLRFVASRGETKAAF